MVFQVSQHITITTYDCHAAAHCRDGILVRYVDSKLNEFELVFVRLASMPADTFRFRSPVALTRPKVIDNHGLTDYDKAESIALCSQYKIAICAFQHDISGRSFSGSQRRDVISGEYWRKPVFSECGV
jgi:hypothetical protein